jgi:ABC-type nickel/cobalt efflux system permease component RcnA
LLGVLVAIFLGALHGLSPGHGKSLVAAYLLGSRNTVWHAVWLGVVVTITHTLGVYVLGAFAWFAEDRFPPEVLLPWMELASGLLVVGVGFALVRGRLRALLPATPDVPAGHAHDHGHTHGHTHSHGHVHADASQPVSGSEHDALEAHAESHAHVYAEAKDLRALIGLGISGGLVPCPSALVLLLTAISFHKTALGLLLVFAFSVGLALLVTGLGILVIKMGDRLRAIGTGGRLVAALPVLSAVVVSVIGVILTIRGLQSVSGM